MKQVGTSQSVDFGHELAAEPEITAMQSHLSDCGACGKPAGAQEDELPVTALCKAKPIVFPAVAPALSLRSSRIAAQLVYDSSLVPAPAGLRATLQVGWRGLYRSGDYLLDLRIEPDPHSTRAAAVGQINNHVAPRENMANLPVLLKSGRTVVAETRSNRFGEFQIEYERRAHLQLCVYLRNGAKRLQVQLQRFPDERNSGAKRLGLRSGQLQAK